MLDEQWRRLVKLKNEPLWRGTVLRMPGKYPYEDLVDFMIVDCRDGTGLFSLLPVTGYEAGDVVVRLPAESLFNGKGHAISSQWLVENWGVWVVADGEPNDVLVRGNYPAPTGSEPA